MPPPVRCHCFPLVPYDRFLRGSRRWSRNPCLGIRVRTLPKSFNTSPSGARAFYYVYEAIPGTKFTNDSRGMNQPRCMNGGLKLGYYDRMIPFREQEFLLLEMFLRCCRFMKGTKGVLWLVEVGGQSFPTIVNLVGPIALV